MKLLQIPLLLSGLLWASVSALGETPTRSRPLDLPAGRAAPERSEEDVRESILFYGDLYESEAFFFLLDTSGSMRDERIYKLKLQMLHAIKQLSSRSRFSIVAFSNTILQFNTRALGATPRVKNLARMFVVQLRALGTTHMLSGAQRLLLTAEKVHTRHKRIIVVGDGLPNYPRAERTLRGIQQMNRERIPFDVIQVGAFDDEAAVAFFQELAAMTGGRYRQAK